MEGHGQLEEALERASWPMTTLSHVLSYDEGLKAGVPSYCRLEASRGGRKINEEEEGYEKKSR